MSLRYKVVSIFAFILFVAALHVFVFPQAAQAAIGGGGNPSGGGGSYWTTYGFGWYSYDVNGAGPEAWATGGPWSTVSAICKAEGAQRVDAFIVQRSGGNDSGNRAKVYRYTAGGFNPAWYWYKGDRGGNWLSLSTAQAHFNSIADKGSYIFGSNVAWFCYNPLSFTLTPTISGSPQFTDGDSTGSDTARIEPVVTNAGPTTSSNATWRLVTFRVPKGQAIPHAGGGDSGTAPETYFGNGAVAVASGSQAFAKTSTPVGTGQRTIGDYELGTRICFALSVAPISQSNTAWRHSAPFCIIIAKAPKVQVHGGDIRVGSGFVDQAAPATSIINTSQTTKRR